MNLHIGSGNKRLPGWQNVDVRAEVKPDYVREADKLTGIASNSVDAIYASHVLEHFPLARVPHVLAEWHRVLVPGRGKLFLAVPDFRVIAWLYMENGTPLAKLRPILWGGQEYAENFHFTSWDYPALVEMLNPNYKDIRKVLDFAFLPAKYYDYSRIRIDGYQCSLNIEGVAR